MHPTWLHCSPAVSTKHPNPCVRSADCADSASSQIAEQSEAFPVLTLMSSQRYWKIRSRCSVECMAVGTGASQAEPVSHTVSVMPGMLGGSNMHIDLASYCLMQMSGFFSDLPSCSVHPSHGRSLLDVCLPSANRTLPRG